MPPNSPPDSRLLRVAIIGTPNSGKSTLTNRLMGWRISSVSKKVHTTRQNTLGVLTKNNTQIVFVDTPGLIQHQQGRKHNLDRRLLTDPLKSLENVNLVCALVDVSNQWTRNALDPFLLEILYRHPHIPSVLILNKVDAIKKKDILLQLTRILSEGVVGGVAIKSTPVRSNKPTTVHKYLEKFGISQENTDSVNNLDIWQGERDIENHFKADRHILPLGWRSPEFLSKKGRLGARNLPSQVDVLRRDTESLSSEEDQADVKKLGEPLMDRESDIEGSPGLEVEARSGQEERLRIMREVKGKKGWSHFDRVFMVSAQTGGGCDSLCEYLYFKARPSPWDFHSSVVTDQGPYEVAQMCVWEKFLEFLPKDIPYKIYPEVVIWEEDDKGVLNVMMEVVTHDRRQFRNFLGSVHDIVRSARQEMMNAFHCEVKLKLFGKLKKKQ